MSKPDAPLRMASADSLAEFVERHPRLFVLTGAGCSTDSGIPDYRDAAGEWKRRPPIMFQAFVGDERARKRYWARSLVGFRRMRSARPNDAHTSLATLEQRGRIVQLVTQNVDGLHHAAGSQNVIDLHGRIDTVRCLGCERRSSREQLQQELERRNPRFARVVECRFFGGMSVEDTAEALGVSPRTVKSDWALARAWLYDTLHRAS